ncbi:unnamed protein product (macronuclear) [Paramecium tetraurelia]|uniref:Uncharacterized protein n=1 Tax=Paramecium tetraurelia TaxID=5888 RepID=A0D1L1_PARTE|nr:uncharacterized protein GSPATT00012452001 [Paramecium tetraurelia]CAK76928.1 unnamed protein product [Paramecium tetraurelia]|eukprot:XP_001444325.1 hypothetical protein (macronuclear) [Paramecium tetraurelia strain d4-2]
MSFKAFSQFEEQQISQTLNFLSDYICCLTSAIKSLKKNEMRKKSIFKRMSSILIKYSKNIKTQSNLGASQLKYSANLLQSMKRISNHYQKVIRVITRINERVSRTCIQHVEFREIYLI